MMWCFFKAYQAYCFVCRPNVRGAYVAVWYAERLLLVEHSYRAGFSFPSGGIKEGETPIDAAQRELHEEIGIQVEPEQLVLAFTLQIDHRNMRDTVSVFEVFLNTLPAIFLDRREVIAARFVTAAEAESLRPSIVVRKYLRRKRIMEKV